MGTFSRICLKEIEWKSNKAISRSMHVYNVQCTSWLCYKKISEMGGLICLFTIQGLKNMETSFIQNLREHISI